MKKMRVKDLSYYLKLPYTVILKRDDEGDLVARVDELQGCTAHGATAQEAIDRLEDEKRAWIEDAIEVGDEVPEPTIDEDLPSGKWLQRVPRSLHAKVVRQAKREGVSLNQFVATVVAETIGKRSTKEAIEESKEAEPAVLEGNLVILGDLHDKWIGALAAFGPQTYFVDHDLSVGPLARRVRLFANQVPRECVTGLKALQQDATKKNTKLSDA